MASVLKRIKKKNESNTTQDFDQLDRRWTKRLIADNGFSYQLVELPESAALIQSTGRNDPDQERLSDPKQSPIADHLTAFEASLADKTRKHARLTMARLRSIVKCGEMRTLADISQDSVLASTRSLQKANGFGHRTYCNYVRAMRSFCKWSVATKRLLSNPMGRRRLALRDTDQV